MNNIVVLDVNDSKLQPFRDLGFNVYCGNVKDVQTREWMGHGPQFQRPIYFVSPANSLGFMDGGIDRAYMNMFPGIQQQVQRIIKQCSPFLSNFGRPFLPIGSAITVLIDEHNALISAPTMLMPQAVPKTNNPYHTMKGILKVWPERGTLVVPALCCGYGKVNPDVAAKEMLHAINEHNFIGPHDHCHYIIKNEKIMLQQPKYYENTEFFDIDPKDVIEHDDVV